MNKDFIEEYIKIKFKICGNVSFKSIIYVFAFDELFPLTFCSFLNSTHNYRINLASLFRLL